MKRILLLPHPSTAIGDPVVRRGNKTVEEIAKEHRQRFPKPLTGGALAVDIVRADRDTR